MSTAIRAASVLSRVFGGLEHGVPLSRTFLQCTSTQPRSLSLSALNTFLERAESELTMSCRESDSHMTEASRCGPHTASSECSCAYAPPPPFPNSPASRGQTIPAGRCGPSMPSPSNVMRAHQQQPARWHARPSNGMHACMPANSPSARITSGLTSSPQPLPTAPLHSPSTRHDSQGHDSRR